MIIKHLWEPADIRPGMWLIRESAADVAKNRTFACSVAYKIGWSHEPYVGGEKVKILYHRVAITDGMIDVGVSAVVLVNKLNADSCGYRPMTQDEIFICIKALERQNVPDLL